MSESGRPVTPSELEERDGLDFLSRMMNLLPEVRWDRCAGGPDIALEGVAYGWIDRGDGRADFVLLRWDKGGVGWTTSSAKYSREFSRRLCGTDEGHQDCRRVEDVFGGRVKNCISTKGGG